MLSPGARTSKGGGSRLRPAFLAATAALAALLLLPATASPVLIKKKLFDFQCPPDGFTQTSTSSIRTPRPSDRVFAAYNYFAYGGVKIGTDDTVCPGTIGHVDSVTVLPDTPPGEKTVRITRTDDNTAGGGTEETLQLGIAVEYKTTADVAVKKEFVGPDSGASAGYPYAWRIVVINRGPGPAKNVLLTDKFPRAFQVYPMAISTSGGEKDYTPPSATQRATLKVEWDSIPPPDPDHPGRNRRVVTVGGEFNKTQNPSVKTVDNVAEVEVASASTVDPKPGNNAAAREVQVYR